MYRGVATDYEEFQASRRDDTLMTTRSVDWSPRLNSCHRYAMKKGRRLLCAGSRT